MLFEFFLFDGEEVGSIFSNSAYNTYVKNAVYTLCGLDIFEIIKKQTKRFVGKSATENEKQLFNEYETMRKKTEELQMKMDKVIEQISGDQKLLDEAETNLIELETAFKKSGGITEAKRKKMLKEVEEAEKVKAEASVKLKMFVEGLMPFFIVKEFTDPVLKQLDFEEKEKIYCHVQQKLKREDIVTLLAGAAPDKAIDTFMNVVLEMFKPDGYSKNPVHVHDLSREENGRVNAMISNLNDFNVGELINTVQQKQMATDQIMEINKLLKNTMTEEEAEKFDRKENKILKEKEELSHRLYMEKLRKEELSDTIAEATVQRDHMWQKIKDNAQNQHVFELSSGISSMMSKLLENKTIAIKRKLELLIVDKLKCIYRKNNLITHIEIDEGFQFHLYQDAEYSAAELTNLIQNLGKDSFELMIGHQGREVLLARYSVNNMNELRKILLFDTSESIRLYKSIDLNRLSKGERQIFILAFYWAIIEMSGQDIPFIIDTPYARIDANHRKEISRKFFPNISKQVVILSTDEEINEEYYEIIKPYISREYLLMNDENQNRTSIEKKYFLENNHDI